MTLLKNEITIINEHRISANLNYIKHQLALLSLRYQFVFIHSKNLKKICLIIK